MPDDRNFFEDDSLPPDGDQRDDRAPQQRPPWEAQSGELPPDPQEAAPTPAPWELHPGDLEPTSHPPSQSPPWSSAPPRETESLDALRQQAGGWETWNLTDDEPPDTPPETPDEPADDLAWMRAFGEAAGPEQPVPPEEEDDLAWLGSVEPGQEPPHEDEPASRRVDPSDLPWVDQETFRRIPTIEPDAELSLSPDDEPPAEPTGELPGWLDEEFSEETPAEAPPEPPAVRPLTSRLRPLDAEPPAEEPPVEDETPGWLSELDETSQPPEPAQPQAQTFEEWERQQEDREREESKTDEDRLLESVPDWLEQLRDQPEAPAAPAEPPASSEQAPDFMPGWVMGLEDQPTEEAPDWFQQLDYTEDPLAAPPEPPAPAEPSDEDEVPDWFKGIGAPGMETLPEPDLDMFAPEAAPAPDTDADAEGEGDFVERFDPIAPDEYGTAEGDMPDWLLGLEPEAPQEPPVPPGPAPVTPESSPADEALDWLDELSPEDLAEDDTYQALFGAEPPSEPAPPAEEQAELGEAELEQLLGSYEAPPASDEPPDEMETWADEAAFTAALDQALPAEGAEPDLDDFFPEVGPGQPVPGLERLFEEEAPGEERPAEDVAPAQTPEWVEDLRPTDLPVTVRAAGIQIDLPQTPIIELPPRVHALRDKALRELEAGAAPPTTAEVGALAGLSGVLGRFDTALPAAEPSGPLSGAVVSREQQTRVQKLQALMESAEEPEEAPAEVEALETRVAPGVAARTARRARRLKLDRVLVALLMLAALIAPFASDALHLAESPPPLGAAGEDLAAELDTLAPGAYVLVALEYGPTAAGELDPLVEAVLRDAFVQGAIPLTISTNIAGTLHAESILARLADDEALLEARSGEDAPSALQAGRDYALLSYLPGDALGVRTLAETYGEPDTIHPAFATDLRGEDTGLPIDNPAEDVALIVVAGEETDDVRAWAEQLRGVDVPKVALVTAALEPMTAPYVYDEGYAGYLAGMRDAYSYNLTRNANARSVYTLPEGLDFDLPNPDDARWHSMALGAAAAAILITLGMVLNLLRALVRRRS